ncbi:helix-turn-helix protein [Thiorhodovibrio winogradskyi]|uniref:Helix-turn-helix protein n=1 Tax=Thiorhodovibrio winogradskyi TaxID=77007 RepID=A0ABZ0SEL5_9GAMM|nr:helix-turn-helix transcriptional regulator [Thiorhodovibrio winogradskyi]
MATACSRPGVGGWVGLRASWPSAGVTQVQIARFETGQAIPRADTLLRLSNAMGVMADLLWDENSQHSWHAQ